MVHPYLTTESAIGEALYFSINLPSPKEPSPGVVALIGFAAEAKHVPLECAGASALHTLPFGFIPGDARSRSLIGKAVLTTSPFVGQLGQ